MRLPVIHLAPFVSAPRVKALLKLETFPPLLMLPPLGLVHAMRCVWGESGETFFIRRFDDDVTRALRATTSQMCDEMKSTASHTQRASDIIIASVIFSPSKSFRVEKVKSVDSF